MDNNYLNIWEDTKKRIFAGKGTCICPNCHKEAVYNHVIQRANILNSLCNNNMEVRIFEYLPLYYNNGQPQYQLKAISKCFGFYGFCQEHDSAIFRPIESNITEYTWQKKESQYLLAYRAILRHKSYSINARMVYETMCSKFPNLNKSYQIELLDNDLQLCHLYHKIIEDGIFNTDYSKLDFFYHTLPYRVEMANASCVYFTTPIYCGPIEKREYYICVFFPFENKTFITIGYMHHNPTYWLDKLKPFFMSNEVNDNYIAINNLILGSGLHCMKPSYYDALPKDKIEKFINDWQTFNNSV